MGAPVRSLDAPMDRVNDLGRPLSLHEVGPGARSDHRADVVKVVVGREGDELRARAHLGDLASGPRPAASGHADVQQRDVRLFPRCDRDGLVGVASGPDDRDLLVVIEQRGQRVTDALLVIGDHHPDHRLNLHSGSSWQPTSDLLGLQGQLRRASPPGRGQRSFPNPPINRSLPGPPTRTSLPNPPINRSFPGPPTRRSLPDPPFSRSLPRWPKRRSFPPRPQITSSWAFPTIRSFPSAPQRSHADDAGPTWVVNETELFMSAPSVVSDTTTAVVSAEPVAVVVARTLRFNDPDASSEARLHTTTVIVVHVPPDASASRIVRSVSGTTSIVTWFAASGPSFTIFRANVTSCPTFTPVEDADPMIERSAVPPGAARTEARTEVNATRKRRTTASFAHAIARGRKRGMADPPFPGRLSRRTSAP